MGKDGSMAISEIIFPDNPKKAGIKAVERYCDKTLHKDSIESFFYYEMKNWLITASRDKSIKILDLEYFPAPNQQPNSFVKVLFHIENLH